MEDDLWWKTPFDRRQPLIDDNLWTKIFLTFPQEMKCIKKTCPCQSCIQRLHYHTFSAFLFLRSNQFLRLNFKIANFRYTAPKMGRAFQDIHWCCQMWNWQKIETQYNIQTNVLSNGLTKILTNYCCKPLSIVPSKAPAKDKYQIDWFVQFG